MSDYEAINEGSRRRYLFSAEKLRIVEVTENGTSVSVVARYNGVAANLLYLRRRLMLGDGLRGGVFGVRQGGVPKWQSRSRGKGAPFSDSVAEGASSCV